jgi:hypothetical protein
MNGNIFNYSLALKPYSVDRHLTYAMLPMPPGIVFCPITGECEPLFTQSYINAYNTAFNQRVNYQEALNKYGLFLSTEVNGNFIPGTFGYGEEYNDQSNPNNNIIIDYLQDDANYYAENPYLFISACSGGGSGYMYLDWVIVTYGVPYVASVS